jgi:predicted homoserine dehydrogenase-like protein
VAKRDLKPGDTLGGIGSADVFHRIYTYQEARQLKGVPMGVAPRAKVLEEIRKGEVISEDKVALDTSRFVYQLYQLQNSTLESDRLLT